MPIIEGDCLEIMRLLVQEGIQLSAIITDPPYGLNFMNRYWDQEDNIAFQAATWKLCLDLLRPGGHLVAFGSTRTYHRLVCAVEDAGFEIRDQLAWIYGCLSVDTHLVTKDGVSSYTTVKPGDEILCYDVYTGEYAYQPVEQLFEYDIKDTAYHLYSDHTDQIVSRNHRCIVERGGVETFWIAEEIQKEAVVPILEDLSGLQQSLSNSYKRRGWKGHNTTLVSVKPIRYEGIVWCVKVPTGAFVAIRNGKAFVTGNSGLPKALDVSKAIDKALGTEREVVGYDASRARPNRQYKSGAIGNLGGHEQISDRSDNGATITAAATPEAQFWEGWKTHLKPSWEPIVLARKPLIGSVAQNVLAHGTGALNIDATRVPIDEAVDDPRLGGKGTWGTTNMAKNVYGEYEGTRVGSSPIGRYPANLAHDGSEEVLEAFEQYGRRGGGDHRGDCHGRRPGGFGDVGHDKGDQEPNSTVYADSGSAARFFNRFHYCPKANKKERRGSNHPTIKPVALMRWLVRLVTPPEGIILDPFAGTGTTGEAAALEGFECVLIERDPQYVKDIERRLNESKTG